jgi:hypothetical protein
MAMWYKPGSLIGQVFIVRYLSFIDPERGEFGGILPRASGAASSIIGGVLRCHCPGLCPEGNIITEGNISTNPPSGGFINDIKYYTES